MASAKDRLVQAFRTVDPHGTGAVPRAEFERVTRKLSADSLAWLESSDLAIPGVDAVEVRYEEFFDWVYGTSSSPAAAEQGLEAFRGIAAGAPSQEEQLSIDPRWSTAGFHEWTCTSVGGVYAIGWLKVGFVRRFARCRGRLERRQDLPVDALHLGPPPEEAKLYAVTHCWETRDHPDPMGSKLRELVHALDSDGAEDLDLIFLDWCSFFQLPRTDLETACFNAAIAGVAVAKVYCFARVRTIFLPRTATPRPYMTRGWCTLESFLATYCNRNIHARGKDYQDVEAIVKECAHPRRVTRIHEVLRDDAVVSDELDRLQLLDVLADLCAGMPAATHDHEGFEFFCAGARLAWVFVRAIRHFAAQAGRPFPRRQELPADTFVEGVPPRDRRKFVVSHGWESEVHPSPSGSKMARLVQALDALGAAEDDVVFFDFLSNPQEAKMGWVYDEGEPWEGAPARSASAEPYFEHNRISFISGRTEQEKASFSYAMWDMGRLYAYQKCEVIVLPAIDSPGSFPGGLVWGMVNATPYEHRGWCCSEFATALKNQRIVNLGDPEVQRVLNSRQWPQTAFEYERMMHYTWHRGKVSTDEDNPDGLEFDEELGVDFTSKGDRHVVLQNFFKMTFDPQAYAPMLRQAAEEARTRRSD